MNKIYKVVWSKAKHCYVVTSELAKRNGKGCGARSLRMAAVSMGVAAAVLYTGGAPGLFGPSVAEAAMKTVFVSDNTDYNALYSFHADAKSVTVDQAKADAFTGTTKYFYGNVAVGYSITDSVTYTVIDGQMIKQIARNTTILPYEQKVMGTGEDHPSRPFDNSTVAPNGEETTTIGALVKASTEANTNVSGYSVTLTGTGLTDAAGALSWGGNVTGNSITVDGGQANTVYGGSTSTGNANENTVTIGSGSSKAGDVYGGYASGYPTSGNANSNHVNVNGGTVEQTLWGGYSVMGNANGNEVTVSSGTVAYSLYGGWSDNKNANKNIVSITGGTVATAAYNAVYGGHAYNDGAANENEVTVSGTANIVNRVIGGYSDTQAYKNTVNVSGNAKIGNLVYGGLSDVQANNNTVTVSGNANIENQVVGGSGVTQANNNTVTISGGTVNSTGWAGAVVGGMSSGGGADKTENGNKVFINGTANVTGDVTGGMDGYYTATASENTVTIDGSAVITGNVMGASGESRDKTENKVYITKDYTGTVTGDVYGGRLDDSGNYFNSDDPNDVWYDKGNANRNEVHISGGTVTGNVYGGAVENNVTGNADGNIVEITGGTVKGRVEGGQSDSGSAEGNVVTVSGGTVNYVVLGAFVGTGSTGNVENNEVTVSGTAYLERDVQGGQVFGSGKAIGNSVTLTGGTASKGVLGGATFGEVGNAGNVEDNDVIMEGGNAGWVYGGYSDGYSYNGGAATGNTTDISGGTVDGYVFGGASYSDSAATGDTNENQVTISAEKGDTTIGGRVFGGESFSGTGTSGNANSNVVTISGGTLSGNVGGGASVTISGTAGNANSNAVTVSGGTINGDVYGGYGYSAATGNTVTLGGGTEAATIASDVYGGFATNGTANDNTVNLKGNTNLAGASLYGSNKTDSTGNELHVGGVKGETAGSGENIWKSGADNKVVKVANFNSIAFHSVKWDESVAALQATTLENVGAIDITNLTFDSTPASGTMSLLKSGNVLSDLTLTYKDGSATATATAAQLAAGVVLASSVQTETAGEGGVNLTQKVNEKVFRDTSDNKAIKYSVAKGNVSGITFGKVTFVNGGMARDLASYTLDAANTVDLSGLTFADTNKALATGNSMTLAANATNVASATAVKNIAIKDYKDATGNAYEATASGTVTAGSNAIKYTVDSVAADKVTLVSRDWSAAADNLLATWTASASTEVDAAAFGYTGTADTALKANDTKAILNATGLTTASEVTGGTEVPVTVAYTDTASGVQYDATAKGHVAAAADVVNYVVDSVDVSKVNLTNWNGTDSSSVATPNGWTGTGVEVTGEFTAPTTDKEIATASAGFFDDSKIADTIKYKSGAAFSEDENGVALAGHQVGGVKAEDSGATLKYYAMKKSAETLTLGTVAFEAEGTARTYTNAYDLTGATINSDGLAFSNEDALTAGSKMYLVDASAAVKGGDGAALANVNESIKKTYEDKSTANLTIAGGRTDTLVRDADKSRLVYTVGTSAVTSATMSDNLVWSDGGTHYTNEKHNFADSSSINVGGLTFTSTTDPLAGASKAMTLIAQKDDAHAVKGSVTGTPKFTVTLAKANTTLAATGTGTAAIDSGNLKYTVSGVALNTVTVNSVGDTADTVPENWTLASGATVETGNMTVPSLAAGNEKAIITGSNGFFANATINGNAYTETEFNASDDTKAVIIAGKQGKGVTKSEDNASILYKVSKKDVSSINIGLLTWKDGGELLDGSSDDYNYENAAYSTGDFAIKNPKDVTAGEKMTLLKANDSLAEMSKDVNASYKDVQVVSGLDVLMNGKITGTLSKSGNNIVFTATENKASKLTFGDVEWKDSGALLARPTNIVFDGATVDTSKIKFTNVNFLDADRQMTLVSDFGDKVGTITGSKYLVGTAFEGEGAASLSGRDLIFRTKTGAGVSEQTHKTVMATEAGVTALNVGSDYIGKALDGMGDVANVAPDGSTVGAAVGGGRNRYETGSHVNVNSWNAAVAVGAKRNVKGGSLEYGVFGEYGKANYTLHSDAGRGDGDARYAGGGVVAKWTNKHDVYTEASFRLGRLSESSSDIMRDGLGNTYGYDVHANYYGAHVGAGKIFRYNGGRSLDVYGKYFYTKRNGVEFDAVQHYNLDSVSSSVLRIGARYGTTDKKWNWYGGLAYEYEFDGEAEGVVNGVAIRAASIKGSSVRGEIGLRMNATKTNPWQTDISIYGYGGKHRGFGGNVNVAYTF